MEAARRLEAGFWGQGQEACGTRKLLGQEFRFSGGRRRELGQCFLREGSSPQSRIRKRHQTHPNEMRTMCTYASIQVCTPL